MNEWQQEWQPTERDNRLHELATRYHAECEAYDQTVCTGPMGQDGIMPATPHEMFENAIRRFGVVAACEWFGHTPDSEFTAETIRVLQERSNDLGNRRDAGPIGGASVLTDGLCGNGNYNERTEK